MMALISVVLPEPVAPTIKIVLRRPAALTGKRRVARLTENVVVYSRSRFTVVSVHWQLIVTLDPLMIHALIQPVDFSPPASAWRALNKHACFCFMTLTQSF